MKKVKKTETTAIDVKCDVIRLVCANLNHKCTAFEKGECKMTKAKCVFQITCL